MFAEREKIQRLELLYAMPYPLHIQNHEKSQMKELDCGLVWPVSSILLYRDFGLVGS